jgi:MFS family permease
MALFFVHAIAMGALHTRIADIQLLNGLTEAQLGLVLIGQPLGGLAMFLFSSKIIERFNPRIILLALLPVVTISTLLVGAIHQPLAMFLFIVVNGIGFSVTNVAINVEADRIEAATGQRLMNKCHGAWSAGFLSTSLLGVLLRGLEVAPWVHFGALVPVIAVLIWLVLGPMPVMPPRAHNGTPGKSRLAWPTLAVLGLVTFGLGAGIAEGASRTWAIIFLRDSFDVPAWVESLALPAILVTMMLGRLFADRWIEHYGVVRSARFLASVAIAGLCLLIFSPNAVVALLAFGIIGLGLCVLYPLMMSAAARIGDRPASQNVAATTLVFQFVNMGAPVLIGAVAQGAGIRVGFAVLLPLLLLTWAMAGRLAPKPL